MVDVHAESVDDGPGGVDDNKQDKGSSGEDTDEGEYGDVPEARSFHSTPTLKTKPR